jgi:tRNA(fMet)-specific endonuclease VapC
MKRFLIDTNIYSAFKINHPGALTQIREAEKIVICSTVHGELLAGFKCGAREKQNVVELEEFLDRPRVATVSVDGTTAEFYGEIFKCLRSNGTPIPTNDIWIAASAMQNGLAVCSFDAHFHKIEGLVTIIPESA